MEQHASISSVVGLGHKLGSKTGLESESLHDVLIFNSEKTPFYKWSLSQNWRFLFNSGYFRFWFGFEHTQF